MKRTLAILFALSAGIAALAQPRTVKGIVLDSLTRQGEPAAILQFFKAGDASKPVAFTTTAEDGTFTHTFTVKGEYYLLFDNMGRKQVRRDFTINGNEVIDLGEILVQDAAEVLKAGTVVAQRPLVKMEVDRMTYNVEDDVDSKTSTVLDMLRKVPMVTVDGQDNITVNGSSSFQVYVDGKPNQMLSQNASTVFKMMPASAVKNIEVVTNPGVRYDAEGVGGVLNITTNREVTGGQNVTDGIYGTLRGMASTRGFGGGLYGSMQKGKFAMSLNLNAMDGRNPGTTTDVERVQDGGFATRTHSETDMRMPMVMGTLNASYEIDSLNLVSATAGLMHFGMTSSGTSSTEMSLPGSVFSYDGTTGSENTRNNINAGADYQHLWADAPGRSFTLSYQFTGSPSVVNTLNTFGGVSIPGFDLTDRRTDGLQNSLSHTFQTDFTTPLGEGQTINTGAKYLYRHNASDQVHFLWNGSEFIHDQAGDLTYDFYNRIGAAYTEYAGTFGKVGFKAGVRYEYTWQTYRSSAQPQPFSVRYGSVVPSASIQWSPAMTQNIGLSYNLRISRPGISYLNPYKDTSDPTALSYGNTDLDVEKGHTFNLVYNYFTNNLMINATLRHSFTGNGISQYSFYDDGHLLNTTYGNIVRDRNTGLNLFGMVTPGPKTRIIVNGSLSYSDIVSETLHQHNWGWNYNAMVGVQQTLPWDLRLSANFIKAGRSVSLQGWSSGMSMGMLGLTKTFFDDRLSLSVNGVTHLTGGKAMTIRSFSAGDGFTMDSTTAVPMRQIVFQVSWTFGKQGNYSAKRTRRSIQNEEQLNSTTTAESMGSMMMQ